MCVFEKKKTAETLINIGTGQEKSIITILQNLL